MTTQTVLIIDDDRAIHVQVSVVLSKAGYRVISAFSGMEGLELAARENPSLLVLDHRMPGMDGIETYRRLRKQPGPARENNALRISNIIRSFNEAATSPPKPYYGDITMLDI